MNTFARMYEINLRRDKIEGLYFIMKADKTVNFTGAQWLSGRVLGPQG